MSSITADRTTRTRRRGARRTRVQHLVAADERSLAELEAHLATLPLCATGRVFIEVPDEASIGFVEAPQRMTVTWLVRACRSGAPGSGRGCGRGLALSRAVCAWAGEMLCDESGADTEITLLGGYLGTADIVEHLTGKLGIDPGRIHAPERFGLLAG